MPEFEKLENVEFEISFQTVDVAVVSFDKKILLGMKPHQKQWRVAGGFVDVRDGNLVCIEHIHWQ